MAVPLSGTNLATFLTYQTFGAPWTPVVRTTTFADPSVLSFVVERYEINSAGSHQSYYFDDQTNPWLMFYQTSPGNVSVNDIDLMMAANDASATPGLPTNLKAQYVRRQSVSGALVAAGRRRPGFRRIAGG